MGLLETRNERDASLRRKLLFAVYSAGRNSLSGKISGESARQQADAEQAFDQRCEDDRHALSLLRDLKAMGLVTETAAGTLRRGEMLRPKHLNYEITEKGASLILGEIPPVKGVFDDRVSE